MRRWASGLGQLSQHDITCDTEQEVVFSTADNMVWCWYIQDHEVEKRFDLYSAVEGVFGGYTITSLLSKCAVKQNL